MTITTPRHTTATDRPGAAGESAITDPATGDFVGCVPHAGPALIDSVIADAARAAPGWARTEPAERGRLLAAAADGVEKRADELARWNQRETGKTWADCVGGVAAAVGTLRQYAQLGPLHRGRSLQGAHGAVDLMAHRPHGVVAVLTPWNDPVAIAAGLIGAAVVTGNTVVHKPSERCPHTGRRFAETVAETLPDDVLGVLDGSGAVGAAVAADERIAVVAHVGGSATGADIARTCAERGAKSLRENGGNDALVIDADVSPRWAAEQAALGAFANAGQICVSVERIYVAADIAEEFLGELAGQAETWRERIGPLVDLPHRTGVHRLVEQAVSAGARPIAGGTIPSAPGAWYPPTVLADCTDTMAVMREEVFGPVAPVQVVDDFAAGLATAAADRYGLGATVLTADTAHAQSAITGLPVGTVKINAVFGGAPGGAAQPRGISGQGFGFGPELLDEMTTTTVVHWQAPGQAWSDRG